MVSPPPPLKPRTRAALALGRVAAASSRLLGRGSGEVVGGQLALRLAPDGLADIAQGRLIACVSATNGKTTTTRLLAAALNCCGPVVSNSGGANMPDGILTALAQRPRTTSAVLEVDELHLPAVATAVQPHLIALLNLSRDQLDRSNETRRIAASWRALGGELPDTTAVANADDPLVAWAVQGFRAVVWVGAGQVWTADAMVCPSCAKLLRRGPLASGDIDWWCPGCGLRRPAPSVSVRHSPGTNAPDTAVILIDGVPHSPSLLLPGRCNLANAAVAVAAARELGVPVLDALTALATVGAVQGRYATVRLGDRPARLLLAKNPAGWVEMLELIRADAVRPVIIDFNARAADGRDPSWIWDVPAGLLAGRPVFVAGERADDVMVRLAYAGIDATRCDSAVAATAIAPGGPNGPVDVLATYTAFRELVVATGAAT
jgi:lipid II isoglutaminyl synthase (glutamine-hydrolysing)